MASAPGFFVASAGIAGALIGLLFVAVSVQPERILGPHAEDAFAVRAGSIARRRREHDVADSRPASSPGEGDQRGDPSEPFT